MPTEEGATFFRISRRTVAVGGNYNASESLHLRACPDSGAVLACKGDVTARALHPSPILFFPSFIPGRRTGMVKKVGPRLRDLASRLILAVRVSSRNLAPALLTITVRGVTKFILTLSASQPPYGLLLLLLLHPSIQPTIHPSIPSPPLPCSRSSFLIRHPLPSFLEGRADEKSPFVVVGSLPPFFPFAIFTPGRVESLLIPILLRPSQHDAGCDGRTARKNNASEESLYCDGVGWLVKIL